AVLRAARLRLGLAGDSGLIFVFELGRSEGGLDADTAPLADAHVPDDAAVLGDLTLQMRRAGAGHSADHSGIGSRFLGRPSPSVDGAPSLIDIFVSPPSFTSTSHAPSCFAARMMRRTSASVTMAGRGLMSGPHVHELGGLLVDRVLPLHESPLLGWLERAPGIAQRNGALLRSG